MERGLSRRRRGMAAVGAALLLFGCSWSGRGLPDYYGEEPELVSIRAQNLGYSHATLSAVRGTETIRMGIVSAQGARTFRVPWPGSAVLQVEIELTSGGRHLTPGRLVTPGEELELIVRPEVRNSVLR